MKRALSVPPVIRADSDIVPKECLPSLRLRRMSSPPIVVGLYQKRLGIAQPRKDVFFGVVFIHLFLTRCVTFHLRAAGSA